jgi:arginine deiminase
MATKNTFGIKVFSEIGKLKEVIVQRPGAELENFDINKRSHFLMDGDLDYIQAGKEHDEFVKILKKNNVKVHLMENLFIET